MQLTKLSLNAGELSDEMAGRIDLQKFQMGLESAENVRVLRVGGVTRRAGTGFCSTNQNEANVSRLQGFRFAEEQGYCLEFGHLSMRVFHNGELLVDGLGDPLEYVTPWASSQVFELQFAQRIDRIIVVHPNVEPHIITREADDTWGVDPFPWRERVWELFGETTVNLTPAATTGDTTIAASVALFTPAWVGTRLRLAHSRPEKPFKKTIGDVVSTAPVVNLTTGVYAVGAVVYYTNPPFTTRTAGQYAGLNVAGNRGFFTVTAPYNGAVDYVSGQNSPEQYPAFFQAGASAVGEQEVSGVWSFETFGTWTGTYAVERSYNNGVTWDTIRIVASSSDFNALVQDSEEREANALFRVLILDALNTSFGQRFSFTVSSTTIFGVARITAHNSATSVDVTVERDFESATITSEWYEDAFNPKNGYPKAVTFHQKRLFFGGSDARPQSVWASRLRRPFDFTFGTFADDGLNFETEATEYESVLWLVSHLSLLVGTTSGIWAISSPDGLSLTPENNAVARQVRHGGYQGIPALPLQNNVLFMQSKGRKIHELTGGSIEYGGYTNTDLTQLASHITRGGVNQIATGEVPDSALFLVVGGQLAVLTYEREQNVVGWTRWVTDGVIESVGVCPGALEDDDIYISVRRGERRFVERFTPDMLRIEENNDIRNVSFLDSSVRKIDESGFTEMTGLGHLEGVTVQGFADGEQQGEFLVTGGKIDFLREVKNALVGLPFTSLVRTMPLDGGTVGEKKVISDMVIRFRNTLGVEVSQDGENWSVAKIEQPRIVTNDPLSLVSGDAQATPHSTWQRKPTISIRQINPLPMTILAFRIKGRSNN